MFKIHVRIILFTNDSVQAIAQLFFCKTTTFKAKLYWTYWTIIENFAWADTDTCKGLSVLYLQ